LEDPVLPLGEAGVFVLPEVELRMRSRIIQSLRKLMAASVALALATTLCSCWYSSRYAIHHSIFMTIALVSHPDMTSELKNGELMKAREVLLRKNGDHPHDPELLYYLGSVELVRSSEIEDRQERQQLQSLAWSYVERASGKFHPADELLAHAYLVGRWGKKRDDALYSKHLKMAQEAFKDQGGKAEEKEFNRRSWLVLGPP
jgi:hypothetical protein